MTVDKTYLVDLYPEFATADSGRIDRLVALISSDFDSCVWGLKRDRGIAARVAHMMKIGSSAASGAAGPVTSERIGDLSRSYAQPGGSDSDNPFMATAYGQDYLALRRSLVAGPRVS